MKLVELMVIYESTLFIGQQMPYIKKLHTFTHIHIVTDNQQCFYWISHVCQIWHCNIIADQLAKYAINKYTKNDELKNNKKYIGMILISNNLNLIKICIIPYVFIYKQIIIHLYLQIMIINYSTLILII